MWTLAVTVPIACSTPKGTAQDTAADAASTDASGVDPAPRSCVAPTRSALTVSNVYTEYSRHDAHEVDVVVTDDTVRVYDYDYADFCTLGSITAEADAATCTVVTTITLDPDECQPTGAIDVNYTLSGLGTGEWRLVSQEADATFGVP